MNKPPKLHLLPENSAVCHPATQNLFATLRKQQNRTPSPALLHTDSSTTASGFSFWALWASQHKVLEAANKVTEFGPAQHVTPGPAGAPGCARGGRAPGARGREARGEAQHGPACGTRGRKASGPGSAGGGGPGAATTSTRRGPRDSWRRRAGPEEGTEGPRGWRAARTL